MFRSVQHDNETSGACVKAFVRPRSRPRRRCFRRETFEDEDDDEYEISRQLEVTDLCNYQTRGALTRCSQRVFPFEQGWM